MKIIKYLFLLSILFTLNSCSDKDSCDEAVCINGNCNNGECECDEGYEGLDCSEVLEPSRILVNDITHLFSPEYDIDSNGQNVSWDGEGGKEADVFVRIYLNSDPGNYTDSGVLTDQVHDDIASFEFSYVFEKPKELYKIEFWDNDNPDDFMISMFYLPYEFVDGFKQKVRTFLIEEPLGIELDLSYEF